MMFALTLLRILLALSLFFVLCSSQKSFLKGLLIGSILGHKKGALLHEKGENKEIHKEYYPAPEKEYVPMPVHEEPRFIPIYIVKECNKKHSSDGHVLHHHDHHHNYETVGKTVGDFETGYSGGYGAMSSDDYGRYGSESKSGYSGTLDGYSESRFHTVRKEPNRTSKGQIKDNNIGIVLSLHKDFEPKY